MRLGKMRAPYYRIVVADARTKRDGRSIETIGKYHPKEDPPLIEVDPERAQYGIRRRGRAAVSRRPPGAPPPRRDQPPGPAAATPTCAVGRSTGWRAARPHPAAHLPAGKKS